MNLVGSPLHHLAARLPRKIPETERCRPEPEPEPVQNVQNVPGQEGTGVPGYRGIKVCRTVRTLAPCRIRLPSGQL